MSGSFFDHGQLQKVSFTFYIIFILAMVIVGFCLLFMIYYGWKYYLQRDHVALKQRYASLAIIEIICSFLWLVLRIIPVIYDYDTWLTDTISVLRTLSYMISQFTLVLRFWLIRFDMKMEIAISNKQWIHIINPHAIQLTQSQWYIHKRATFGKLKWMVYHFVIPYIVIWFTCVTIVDFQKSVYTISHILHAVFNVYIPLIVLWSIYCKLPGLKDSFFIFDELKLLIIVYIIKSIIYVPYVISYAMSFESEWLIINGCSYFFIMACVILISLISTAWVLKKLKSVNIVAADNVVKTSTEYLGYLSLSSFNCNIFDTMQARQLKQILADKDSFSIYINYLSREISIKFMLSFIEIVQIQKYIVINVDTQLTETPLFTSINFYDNIPKSQIVFGINDEEQKYVDDTVKIIKSKSEQLYYKYIQHGSRYEIILNTKTHDRITDVMSHLDWIELDVYDINMILKLWDDVTKELFILLLDGFSRFQTTIQYKNMNLDRLYNT
eukprot:29935_1